MSETIVQPTNIRRSAEPGETVTQNFVVYNAPHGYLTATIIGDVSYTRLKEFVAYKHVDTPDTDANPEELPPHLRDAARRGELRSREYVEVGRVGAGTPLFVSPEYTVEGIVEFVAPSTSSSTTESATLVIEGSGYRFEIPLLFIIGSIQVEFFVNPVVIKGGETVDLPIRVSLPAGAPTTEIKLSSFEPRFTIPSQSLTVPGGGSASITLQLQLDDPSAPIGPTSTNLWVDDFSGRRMYVPFNVEIKEWTTQDFVKMHIQSHWRTLGGKPGEPVSDLESTGNAYFIKYRDGAIYSKSKNAPAAWLSEEIRQKYEDLGGTKSWLGLPTDDVIPLKNLEGGKASSFENGDIYWWPDIGAFALNEVVIAFTGIHCYGETDFDGILGAGSDEVYATFKVVGPQKDPIEPIQTGIYENVDAGESITDYIELYRGKPWGVFINLFLKEHDAEDPNKYKAALESSCRVVAGALTVALVAVPKIGPLIATIAAPIFQEGAKSVAEDLNSLLNLEDDPIGSEQIIFSCKEMVLAANTNDSNFEGINFSKESKLMSGEGSSYKVYFNCSPVIES
ncbi:hypothetical protein V7457_18630 [Bacillus toyonensis]